MLFGVTSIAVGTYAMLGVTALATLASTPVGLAMVAGIAVGIAASSVFNYYINNKKVKRKWNQIGQNEF